MFALHKFQNCKYLERCVRKLDKESRVTVDVMRGFDTYHFALLHKLKSAEHYMDGLDQVLKNSTPQNAVAFMDDLTFAVNINIDGFLYSGGSALDILAREVMTYFGISMPSNVYYQTAYQELKKLNPTDPLLARLADPSWKKEFINYRNAATHEVLLMGKFNIEIEPHGGSSSSKIVYPLPDDPKLDFPQRTYTNNPDASLYCKATFKRVVSHINIIYSEICSRSAAKGKLPL